MEYIRKSLYDDICANSNIVSGDEYRELVCAIAQVASDMVVKTLGPYGYTTVIDEGTGFTYPSKDGWTCLNKLQFTDPTYNTIFNMLKKISFNSVATVGDGTTTAMVAASNFLKRMYTEFIPNIEKQGGFRQADFIETMNYLYGVIEDKLKNNPNIKRVSPDNNFEDIKKIAYVATNGNSTIAKLIQEIYKETNNPYIHVTLEKIPETTYEIQKGYKFDARTLNFPLYVNDVNGIINEKNQPQKIVIFDHNVTFQSHEKIIGSYKLLAKRDNYEIIL
jgi:chaperonin GroEL (HSP60 family)